MSRCIGNASSFSHRTTQRGASASDRGQSFRARGKMGGAQLQLYVCRPCTAVGQALSDAHVSRHLETDKPAIAALRGPNWRTHHTCFERALPFPSVRVFLDFVRGTIPRLSSTVPLGSLVIQNTACGIFGIGICSNQKNQVCSSV